MIRVCVQLVGDTITDEGQALVFSESGTAIGEHVHNIVFHSL